MKEDSRNLKFFLPRKRV